MQCKKKIILKYVDLVTKSNNEFLTFYLFNLFYSCQSALNMLEVY